MFLFVTLVMAGCGGQRSLKPDAAAYELHPDSLATRADQNLGAGDVVKAGEYYRAALSQDPGHVRSLRALVNLSADLDDPTSSFSYLQKLSDLDASTPADFCKVASAMQKAQQRDRARDVLKEGLEAFPGDPQISTVLARSLAVSGLRSEAIATLRSSVAGRSGEFKAPLGTLGELLFEDGSYEEALPVLQTFEKKYPGDFLVNMRIAYIHMERQEPDLAVDRYVAAAEAKPESVDARVGLARAYEEQGRPKAAARAYDKAIKLRGLVPEASPLILGLANAYNRQSQFDRTTRLLEECESKFPLTPGLHCAYGMALAGDGRYDKAIEEFDRATGDRNYSEFARAQIARIKKLRQQSR